MTQVFKAPLSKNGEGAVAGASSTQPARYRATLPVLYDTMQY